ncbi:DUF5658 family protein [Peribacillus frigoritolerans]|uniref:DUF5658 family protein n=1 Tax=Peribacillus frigoritolerans TaxID=450367 RepID=UPI00105A5E0F|nr:DUF5658 family protein [Peribacillus frigoritolerans]TDL82325.1 hypothetical protein E2R53_01745 [Peribacillus frigoritolerans]
MKRAFIFLAVVNALDALLTVIGLQYDLIAEANPFMKLLYEIHPLLFAGFKLSFSIFLLLFIFFRCLPSSAAVKFIAYTASIAYGIVLAMHVYWIHIIFI